MKTLATPMARATAPRLRRPLARNRAPETASRSPAIAMRALGIAPALVVGAVNDPLEHEAEVNAERVASGGQARIGGMAAEGQPQAPRLPLRRDGQPSLDQLDNLPPLSKDMHDPNVPAEADVPIEAVSAGDMAEIGAASGSGADAPEASGDAGSDAGDGNAAPSDDAGDQVQASRSVAEVGAAGGAAPADIAARIATPATGRPLPATIRGPMEQGFERSFAGVVLHDTPADRIDAARLGARAFTHGRHIWLGPGESVDDRRLMAHELTHVVQQTGRAEATPGSAPRQVRRLDIGAEEIESLARRIPGYYLLTVVLGSSPITQAKVDRTPENLLQGLLGMVPGGYDLFEQLRQAGIVQEAFRWVTDKLNELDLSLTRVKAAVAKAWELFTPLTFSPIEKIKPAFAPLLSDIATFAIAAKDQIVGFIIKGALKLAGPYGEQIWALIGTARDTIRLIVADPLKFAKNLIRSVVGGFNKFKSNIFDHLKRGLLGWLFGAIEGADLKMPARLDLKGLMSIGFQLVGLTWERIRARLVKNLDPAGEKKMSLIEKAVDVVRTLVTEGFAGIWRKMLQYIDNLKQTVIEGIKSFVISKIVEEGIKWLIGLSNPVGAIIKLAMTIYNVITVFLERLQQIIALANSLFSSMGAIAAGRIEAAVDKVEETMGRLVPVVISFIAGFLGLNGIAGKIRDIIKKLRKPVDNAVDKVSKFLIKKAKLIFSKLIGKLNRKRKLPSTSFTFGKRQHRLFTKRRGEGVEVMMASTEQTPGAVSKGIDAQQQNAKGEDKTTVGKTGDAVEHAATVLKTKAKQVKPKSKKQNQATPVTALDKAEGEEAKAIEETGKAFTNSETVDTEVETGLLRVREPRDPKVEGQAGAYGSLGVETKKAGARGTSVSTFYENDHVPEKQFARAVLNNLDRFAPGPAASEPRRAGARGNKGVKPPAIGELGAKIKSIDRAGKDLPAMTIFRVVHDIKNRSDIGKRDAQDLVTKAAHGKTGEEARVALSELLTRQLQDETALIAKEIRQDKSADPAIKAAVEKGLGWLTTRNRALFGLGGALAPPSTSTSQEGDKQTDLSEVPMSKGDKAPNFAVLEGQYGPYGQRIEGFGRYIEYDHIISKGWPLRARATRFSAKPVKEAVKAALKDADLTDPAIKTRANRLLASAVFPASHPVQSYTINSGGSAAIYRPVHRIVTAAEAGPRRSDTAMAEVDRAQLAKPVIDYVVGGKTEGLDAARKVVRSAIRSRFLEKTSQHVGALKSAYEAEYKQITSLNAGNKAADGAIEAIRGRIDKVGEKATQQNSRLVDG